MVVATPSRPPSLEAEMHWVHLGPSAMPDFPEGTKVYVMAVELNSIQLASQGLANDQ